MSPIKRHGVPLPRAEPTRSVPNASSFGHWMALFYPNVQHLVVAAYKPMTLDGGWKGHWGLHVVELTLAYGPCAADREGGLEDVPRVTKEDLDLIADRVQMDVTVEMFTGGEVWEWRRVP